MSERDHPCTVVFCDLEGSTALAERVDAESWRALLGRYFDEIGAVHGAHGGKVVKIIGDAIVVVFDGDAAAERATAAAVAAVATLDRLNDEFERAWGVRIANRSGIATGALVASEVTAGSDADVLAGDVVSVAETLESNAPPMRVLVDLATARQLGDDGIATALGPLPRKGRPGQVDGWLVEAITKAPASRIALDARDTNSGGDTRRTVTLVFADPSPASSTSDAPSATLLHHAMERFFATTRPIIDRHGGIVEKFIGDALMAVFGLPVRHEDDAVRAVRAAAEIATAVDALNVDLAELGDVRLRCPIGVNTGAVVAGDASLGQRFVTGDAVNVAARLQQAAAPGEVVLGGLTRQLAGDAAVCESLAPLSLKGKSASVPAFRLLSVAAAPVATTSYALPLIGRTSELGALRSAFATALDARRANRVTVVGDAGVGKSRLTFEFVTSLPGAATVLRGNCLSYGDGITFWPLQLVIQQAAGIAFDDDADAARSRIAELPVEPPVRDRLAALARLSETPYPVSELVWAMRRLLEALAADAPVVVVLDDIHWAEPRLIDAVDELTTTVGGPVLMLCTSRPLVDDEQERLLATGSVVKLGPLSRDHCRDVVRELLGDVAVDERVVERISEAADGNPLFLEQLLSMFIDVGMLRRLGDRWAFVGDLSQVALPATIEALLADRIDRLPPPARRVIEPASVIGRDFEHAAVAVLTDVDDAALLDPALMVLEARELIHRAADDRTSRFQHQLIRDATYGGLLKETRSRWHECFASWLGLLADERDRGNEIEEIQGFHLEQAFRYRAELGTVDERSRAVGARAADLLHSAGHRAIERGDMPAAANLLVRAANLLPEDHPDRPAILVAAGNALHETGAIDAAVATFDAAEAAATSLADQAAASTAAIERLRLQYLSGRVEDPSVVHRRAVEAIGSLAATDADALSRAWQLMLNVDIAACRWDAAHDDARAVIDNATAAGNRLLAVRTMPLLAFLAQKGPEPVAAAIETCEAVMQQVADDQRSRAMTQFEVATLAAMGGDLERARAEYTSARLTLAELGWNMQASLGSLNSGPIELLADDPVRAEAELRRDYDALHRMGERNFISLVAALLAHAVYRHGRFDEARRLVDEARQLAAADDLAVHIVAGSVAAKCDARAGRPDTARALVNEAIALVDGTQDPSGQADVRLDLAEVAAIDGDRETALAAVAAAAERYGRKGNVLGAARAARIGTALRAGIDALTTR